METQTYIGTLIIQTCYTCGMAFGLDREFNDRRLKDHKNFCCPDGHQQHYIGETAEQRLQKQIQSLETHLTYVRTRGDELRSQVTQLNYSIRAQKAAKTKILNRVKNGVCPCCNRTFQDLQNHFKSKHPELLSDKHTNQEKE